MAEERKSYPRMPIKQWWALREKFKQTMPPIVNPNYLATVLGMTEVSAKTNILPTLKAVGLIDTDNRTTERARLWRGEDSYEAVCKEIREDIYPKDLIAAFPVVNGLDRASVSGWFLRNLKVGSSAANSMATFYLMLTEADQSKSKDSGLNTKRKAAVPKVSKAGGNKDLKEIKPDDRGEPVASGGDQSKNRYQPSLHIDLQIHISPDAPPDQIDLIFSHLQKLYKNQGY